MNIATRIGAWGGENLVPQIVITVLGSSFTVNSSSQGITTDDASPLIVDWGDGTTATFNSGTKFDSHTYSSHGTWYVKIYSQGVITRLEKACFYMVSSIVAIDLPTTGLYLGSDSLRSCRLTEFTFQRNFTYGSWPLYDNVFTKFRFEGMVYPTYIDNSIRGYLRTVEFGNTVGENDIEYHNASACGVFTQFGSVTDLVVDSDNPYYEVRTSSSGIPQIVRKSDNCLVLIAYGLVGGNAWTGGGIDASVRKMYGNLAQGLTSTSFTLQEGITHIVSANFCRDSSTLKEVTLPSTLLYLGEEWSFYNSPNIEKINCHATTPPTTGGYGHLPTSAVVHVPSGCASAYAASAFWSSFSSIVDDL